MPHFAPLIHGPPLLRKSFSTMSRRDLNCPSAFDRSVAKSGREKTAVELVSHNVHEPQSRSGGDTQNNVALSLASCGVMKSDGTRGRHIQNERCVHIRSVSAVVVDISATYIAKALIRMVRGRGDQGLVREDSLYSIRETSVVTVHVFSDRQDRNPSIRYAKARENGSWHHKRLLAVSKGYAAGEEQVAGFLCIWRKLYSRQYKSGLKFDASSDLR